MANNRITNHGASIWDTAARRLLAKSVLTEDGKLKYHPTLIAAIARGNPAEVIRVLNPSLHYKDNNELPAALKYKDLAVLESVYGDLLENPVQFAMKLCNFEQIDVNDDAS